MVRRFATEAMNDAGTADGLQPSQQASDLSGAFGEQFCGLGLDTFAA